MARSGVRVELKGMREAIAALRFYQIDKKARVKTEVATYTLLVESTAKDFAPVDTGRLRASIHSDFRADGLGGSVSTNVEYAQAQELGTRRMPAQPFMFPAAERWRVAYEQAITNALRTR
ncbi:HK97-gp10 family putative phage morphogenesis protein [Hymenobacter psychrophilus]|uniref:Phage protein, HK97 gp10 family n=1 Tax=Hymenobacter psychrophilus TaxID=651662 RepID=A0A1H3PB31_9BACT|nr:HK97-gp10 family putative phage morphogenesis protein [Hymenobacter psychrophilus]SDY97599.1 phage protein, HK97 gp10 family [Hymenobacter psychrophilus]